MSSRLELTRNNVKAGVWVTVCLGVGLAVTAALTDLWEKVSRSYDSYVVEFEVLHGIDDLGVGSSVRVGGLAAGRVTELMPVASAEGVYDTIVVRFDLESDYELHGDAAINVDGSLIGSESWLSISNLGSPDAPLAEGDVLTGLASPGMLATLLGPENANKAGTLVDDASRIMGDVGRVTEALGTDYEAKFRPILNDVNGFTGNLDGWSTKIDAVMEDAPEVMSEARATVTETRAMVTENREAVKEIVENVQLASVDVRNVARTFDQETIVKINTILESSQAIVDDAADVVLTFSTDYDGWATHVGETLANLSLSSQQVKLAAMDIKSNVWKLMYRPTTDELQNELLHEAARSFAMAAADLKASVTMVDRVMTNHGERLSGDDGAFTRLQQGLTNSLENYEKAQKQLYEVLVDSE